MQKRSSIARLTSLFLTGLFFFLTIYGKEINARQAVAQKAKAKISHSHKPSSDTSKDCTISELSSAMVVSPVTPYFSQDFFLIPLSFSFETLQKATFKVSKPVFRLAYFEILFEHFIVTRGP